MDGPKLDTSARREKAFVCLEGFVLVKGRI
jgi:hypothetical protein